MSNEFDIKDWDYLGSAIGNAVHSGLTMEDIWWAVLMSSNVQEFDAAISAATIARYNKNTTSK